MDEVYRNLQHLGGVILQAFFLYLMGRIFHSGSDLRETSKKPWHRVVTEVMVAFLGVLGVGALIVLFVGV